MEGSSLGTHGHYSGKEPMSSEMPLYLWAKNDQGEAAMEAINSQAASQVLPRGGNLKSPRTISL